LTPKLKELPFNQISPIIAKGLMLLGIKGDRLPSQPEVEYMVKMLQEDYGNLPIGELDLAFELMVKGKLDENPETYQNFSVLYLSRMMGSYARFMTANYVPIIPEDKQIELPKEDLDLDYIYQIYLKNPVSYEDIFMGLSAFKIIHERKLFEYDATQIYKLTIEAIKNKDKREAKKILADEDRIEILCKRMVVKLYFEQLKTKQ